MAASALGGYQSTYLERRIVALLMLPRGQLLACRLSLREIGGSCCFEGPAKLLGSQGVRIPGDFDGEAHGRSDFGRCPRSSRRVVVRRREKRPVPQVAAVRG